jgi:tetratricopeptide (TPR) repeat protein
LIDYASVAAEEVHPLYLGLCADVVLAARAQGKFLTPDDFPTAPETPDKSRVLINRLLRYVDKEVEVAVHALSACRAFDFELYLKLGQALHLHATHAAFFDILTRFSFVWQAQRRGENWYRIHDLLRRLDDESGNELTRRAHEVLEEHYRERGEVAEAIYHANRLDWERGVVEWCQVFEQALQQSRYELCSTLIQVRSELSIHNEFQLGNVSRFEGEYFAFFAGYEEAKEEYLEAIKAYDQALKLTPNDFRIYNNKGSILLKLGDLQVQLVHLQDSLNSYQKALAVYNQAAQLAPNEVDVINNKGNALLKLGDLYTRLRNPSEALQSYQQAIAVLDEALDPTSNLVELYNTKGLVLLSLGDLQVQLAQPQDALYSYQSAIAFFDHATELAPESSYTFNNKGSGLRSLGDLQVQLARPQDALNSYEQAIKVYDQILKLAAKDLQVFTNKGNVLAKQGNLQAQFINFSEALQSYERASNCSF